MDVQGNWRWEEMESSPGAVHWPGTPGVYAVQLRGDAMQPRYRSGTFAIVRNRGECEPGSDVLVVLIDGTAMIRELASDTGGFIVLRRLRDGERQTISRVDVRLMHRVVGQVEASELISATKEG